MADASQKSTSIKYPLQALIIKLNISKVFLGNFLAVLTKSHYISNKLFNIKLACIISNGSVNSEQLSNTIFKLFLYSGNQGV